MVVPSRFQTLMAALLVTACTAPASMVGENVMVSGYKVQKDGAAVIRAELAKQWQQQGWDPSAYPKSFNCGVEVATASFLPEERSVLDAFARNPTYRNYAEVQDAVKARNGRIDIDRQTEQQCAEFRGS